MYTVALCCMLLGCSLCATAQTKQTISTPKEMWVIKYDGLSAAEQLLVETTQGLANRTSARVWLRGGSMYDIVEKQLAAEGVHFHEVASSWDLVKQFRGVVQGMVVCKLRTPSVNAATSLCGILDGVAVDESLMDRATSEGLPILADARNMTDKQVWEKYRDRFTRGVALEQSPDKPGNMRDFSVAHRAFAFWAVDSEFRTEVAKALGPTATVYGWGPDEFGWIRDLSKANATGGPSDWAINLSALEKLPAGKLKRPAKPAIVPEPNVRYIAFVMSDGDNLQWLLNSFVDNASFWASPLRGEYPMTWEVSDLLPSEAPLVLKYLYSTAKKTDGFVAGAGVPGYTFPYFQTDRVALAKQAEPLLEAANLPVVSVLNANEGSMQDCDAILDLPSVHGVIYKDYAPYHRRHGEIYWRNGKPCVSYRFVLWEGLMSPEQLASGVEKMPTDPVHDANSYALVNVHAWSYGKSGGPLAAVKRTIDKLPPNTRVITADQLVEMMRLNLKR